MGYAGLRKHHHLLLLNFGKTYIHRNLTFRDLNFLTCAVEGTKVPEMQWLAFAKNPNRNYTFSKPRTQLDQLGRRASPRISEAHMPSTHKPPFHAEQKK